MNKKGQALVEFIIILPVFLMLVLAFIDFGKIIYTQNILENKTEDIITMYKNGSSYDNMNLFIKKEIANSYIEIANENNEYIIIYLKKEVKINTPGLSLILDNPYNVSVKRVIYYE